MMFAKKSEGLDAVEESDYDSDEMTAEKMFAQNPSKKAIKFSVARKNRNASKYKADLYDF